MQILKLILTTIFTLSLLFSFGQTNDNGFGALTTSDSNGSLDWNHFINARSGNGYNLLRGNAANGPANTTNYFHPFNFEYNKRDGTGAITQLAIPYGNDGSIDMGLRMRGRYAGSWTPWVKIISENAQGNVGIGTTSPTSKLHVEGRASVGKSGVLSLDWTYQSNWNGSSNNWAGYVGFNANRSNDDVRDFYYGSNKYTNKGVFEGSNYGFRWLYRNRIGSDSDQQHLLTEYMRLDTTGNLGIGTTTPAGKLHINTTNTNGNYNTIFDANSVAFENGGQSSYIRKLDTGKLFFSIGAPSNYVMSLSNNGNIGIGTGTANADEKLTVNGKIHTEEVRVDLTVPGPDYVFEKYFNGESVVKPSYNMPTLKEVEAFTKANHHLPELPSAQEMQDNGMELKAMNLKLLQKIEELTLYAIEQQKKLEQQQTQFELQQRENKSLNKRLENIEALISKFNN